MSWALTDKVCNAKNMRLSRVIELHYMYVAHQKSGLGEDFHAFNY